MGIAVDGEEGGVIVIEAETVAPAVYRVRPGNQEFVFQAVSQDHLVFRAGRDRGDAGNYGIAAAICAGYDREGGSGCAHRPAHEAEKLSPGPVTIHQISGVRVKL